MQKYNGIQRTNCPKEQSELITKTDSQTKIQSNVSETGCKQKTCYCEIVIEGESE